jgi:DNA polymerase-1
MEYTCFNCEEILEINDSLHTLEENICSYCYTNLNLDIYSQCVNCNIYYLNNYLQCLSCEKLKSDEIIIPELNYIYIKNDSEYQEAINYIKANNILGLDTEGNGLDPFTLELFLIQIGTEEIVYIFDYRWYERLSKEKFWKDKYKLWIIHNVKFDYKVLKHKLGIELINIFDTFLAERILTCGIERKNSLKNVVEKYLNIRLDKEVVEEFISMKLSNFEQKISKEMLEYSAKDVQLLPLIYKKQKWELQNSELMNLAKLEFEVCQVVSEMELKGIYVDINSWRKIIEFCEIKKQETEDRIHNLLIDEGFASGLFGTLSLNLNSTKTLKEIFSKLGITITSTGDADLAQIEHPLANLLRDYRKYEKQISSFGESFLQLVRKETNRVHPNFQQIGADTGRFSCSSPNLQQIPAEEEYRKCFSAPAGRKIIACDYSQQELRLLASLSGDQKFIKFYEDGVDLHTATASMMFNIPMEKVEKDTHRKVAKTINFGLAYGQGAKKLGLTIGVDEQEAINMINKYFSQFTFIRDWLENAAKEAQSLGYSKTLLGRKRFYNIPTESNPDYKQLMSAIGRQGKNTPIQGSGVDMIKLALVKIHNRLKEENLDAFLINVVHDEIIVEASEQDAEKAAMIVKLAMEEAGRQLAPNVPIVAEEGIGEYWKH